MAGHHVIPSSCRPVHLHHHACWLLTICTCIIIPAWLPALVSVTSQHHGCQLLATAFATSSPSYPLFASQHHVYQLLATAFPSFQPMLFNLHHRACQFAFASPSSQLLATLDVHHCPASYRHLHCWLYCICIVTPPVAGYITSALSHHKLLALYMHHNSWPIAS